jgi:hypothetical protein
VKEDLIVTPRHGVFDVGVIREWLDARPDTFEDPREENIYYICGYPSSSYRYLDDLLAEQTSRPHACVATLGDEVIYLNQERGGTPARRSAMDFLAWLMGRFDCGIRENGYADLSEQVQQGGVPSLYDEDVRTAQLPWIGSLIGVGFFREMYHGDTTGPSLEVARQREPIPEEEALATYLDSGHLFRRAVPLSVTHAFMDPPAGDSTYDRLADDSIDIGPPHLLTDGVYVWPADLPYYLRTYHVRLPRAFIVHAKRNGWHVPSNVDIASLPSFEV